MCIMYEILGEFLGPLYEDYFMRLYGHYMRIMLRYLKGQLMRIHVRVDRTLEF